MEYTDLEGRIRRLQCLLDAAKEGNQFGMVVYYQVMIEDVEVVKKSKGKAA
ncbi:MAG: hypothetical protein ACTH58_04785 [Marinomonas foliarum]|uniref:hypothetical protein n=1 Tax=Marinomonas foliarum TaxID=491950 RepID=UPI003F9C4B99